MACFSSDRDYKTSSLGLTPRTTKVSGMNPTITSGFARLAPTLLSESMRAVVSVLEIPDVYGLLT